MHAGFAAVLLVAVWGALAAPAVAESRIEQSRDLTPGARAPAPHDVLIYNFDGSLGRDQIQVTGLNQATVDAASPAQRAQEIRRAANYLADALEKALQKRGVRPRRVRASTPVPEAALVITGRLVSVDEGAAPPAPGEVTPSPPLRVRVAYDARQGPAASPRLHWQGRVATTTEPLAPGLLSPGGLAEAAERWTGVRAPRDPGASGREDPVVRYTAEMADAIAADLYARFVEQGWVAR